MQLYELHGAGERWFFTMEVVPGRDALDALCSTALGGSSATSSDRREDPTVLASSDPIAMMGWGCLFLFAASGSAPSYKMWYAEQYPTPIGGNRELERGNGDVEGEVRQVKKNRVPDAYELRLLLGQELGTSIEFAANVFYDQELGGNREREFGLSTATSYALRGEYLKVGLETSYRNTSEHGARSQAKNIFELGPSFTFKPSTHTRFDVAPLAGVTSDSLRLELFAIFSVDFGTAPEAGVRAPVAHGRY